MHQQRTEQIAHALAAYRAFRRQDPAEQRLTTFINILNSLFPPLSSSHCADDLLLANILMSDPKCSHTQQEPNTFAEAHSSPITQEVFEEHPTFTLSQHANYISIHPVDHAETIRAAPGIDYAPVAKQQPCGIHYTADVKQGVKNNMSCACCSAHVYGCSSSANQRTLAPRLAKVEPLGLTLIPTSSMLPPCSETQPAAQPRPRPRPRPQPVPAPEPSLSPTLAPPASFVSVPTYSVPLPRLAPIGKGKGRAFSATPCPPSTSTTHFIGHGIMKPLQFSQRSLVPSGLRLKPPPSPNNPFLCSSACPTKLDPGSAPQPSQFHAFILPNSALKGLASSGRPSSPIDLCLSEKADDEDSNILGLADLELFKGWDDSGGNDNDGGGDFSYIDDNNQDLDNDPDKMEGFAEAYRRTSSAARSSSPPELSKLLDLIDKCGLPVMEPDDLWEFLLKGRHGKTWFLVEKEDRWRMALMRQPGSLWNTMESDVFLKQRKSSAIMQQTHKILPQYKEIKFMVEVRGLTVDLEVPKIHAICSIEVALSEACERGDPITSTLTPVEVYYWFEQNWYQMIDAKLGNHSNYRIATHRSGHVSPRRIVLGSSSSRSHEKRPCETNPLSPPPRDTVCLRPNASAQLSTPTSPALAPVFAPSVPDIDANMPRNATPGPSGTAARSAAAVSNPNPAVTNPASKTSMPSVGALTEAICETCLSTREFQEKLLDMRQVQLKIDARSVDNTYKLVSDEQAAMEEERLNRIELEQERANREAAELEDCVDLRRKQQFFEQCLQAVSRADQGVASNIVGMANEHLRLTIKEGLLRFQPFVAPRSPARSDLCTSTNQLEHAAPVPASNLSLPVTTASGTSTVLSHAGITPLAAARNSLAIPPSVLYPHNCLTRRPSAQLPQLQTSVVAHATRQQSVALPSPLSASTSTTQPPTPTLSNPRPISTTTFQSPLLIAMAPVAGRISMNTSPNPSIPSNLDSGHHPGDSTYLPAADTSGPALFLNISRSTSLAHNKIDAPAHDQTRHGDDSNLDYTGLNPTFSVDLTAPSLVKTSPRSDNFVHVNNKAWDTNAETNN
ncbi:SH3 domain-containing protein [Rhizoctonia solani]|uniref:SH3 domain-containing protein n=1 Tax=Rhizoctonia solani TaxID=456999 RepID=A0A8H8P6B0_9AGAM|nr:SH3 domain-containing protein [Rhizoctonia solani]QRW24593.1 SH3 domain-containing protein [Rhizoctonia solani]